MAKIKKPTAGYGFTVAEVLVAIILGSVVIGIMATALETVIAVNSKASRRADAGSLAFKKIQDYINVDFSTVPIGSAVANYEVEDFSAEAQSMGLQDAVAKVYIEPASEASGTVTNTVSYTEAVSADTAYATGAEYAPERHFTTSGGWRNPIRIRDNNFINYTHIPDGTNVQSPSIDLGSARDVDTIRVNYYYCGYGFNNFSIEAKNSSPTNNSGWTTILSGLTSDPIPCSVGNHFQDFDVSGNIINYRYWRLNIATSQDSSFTAISELEAFSSGTPSDVVEQRNASAPNPGGLDFSSSALELTNGGVAGQQSVGIKFNDVAVPKDASITNAYISFTSSASENGYVQLRARGVMTDSMIPWTGAFAVDNAIDTNSSDGLVGTNATTIWEPSGWPVSGATIDTRLDVTSIIQEIVNGPGWVTGNNLAVALTHLNGLGLRQATRSPAPQLVVVWDETTVTVDPGGYIDANGDGDVDNPTLLRLRSIIEYKHFNSPQRVEYVTYMRQFGVGD